MTEISLSELGKSVSVPPEEISMIEDIWPERVQLFSSTPGDYDLVIPFGVGEGATEIFKFRNFQIDPSAGKLDASQALHIRRGIKNRNGGSNPAPRSMLAPASKSVVIQS